MSGDWLCDNCLSKDISIFKDKQRKENEMDCYCNSCKGEHYIVSSWWINNSKEVNQ
tara:strand:+ start:328 stop:495 length:168 start_codon:yes stop_codon:yes gene_type:complete